MLSAVIQSEHSYGAVHLAVQPPDQRFVHFGPLVVHSPISRSTDYIFIHHVRRDWDSGILPIRAVNLERTDSSAYKSCNQVHSRYGVSCAE